MSGFAAMNGLADGPPVLPPIALADGIAAITGAMMVMVALHHRSHSGIGQVIDLSLVEPMLWILGPQATVYDALGIIQERTGSRTPFTAPRNLYRTSDEKWIAISGSSENIATRILQVVGDEAADRDPRFATNSARIENQAELDEMIGKWVEQRTQVDALALLEDAEAAVGPVYDAADIVRDPHFRERQSLVRYRGILMQGIIGKLSRTPGAIRRPAPEKGEHGAEVLAEAGLEWSPLPVMAEQRAGNDSTARKP
jgi:crotonobetainyl-CoA:carnitine CoA-transferase CaiB-like acyl-CoA transferase